MKKSLGLINYSILYVILIIITFLLIPIEPQLKKLLFYCLFALSLGKIFDLIKDNK